MTSDRTQRRVQRLLDQIDTAEADGDWNLVHDLASDVLEIAPGHAEALAYLHSAERRLERAVAAEPPPDSARVAPSHPTSFASGRYEVNRFLGEGGKKRVYLAHDTLLDRDVAFALIKAEGLDDAGRQRIQREAQAMGRLGSHPNIVTVNDIGQEGERAWGGASGGSHCDSIDS
jgi:hypothetical protein